VVRALATDLPGEVELAELVDGDDGFLGLAVPELDPLVTRLCGRFPDAVPYGGRYGATPRAHVTLTLGADEKQAQAARAAVGDALPLRSRVLGPYFVRRTPEGWQPVTDG
jgi:hypothetical protein